MDWKENKKK